MRGGFEGVGNIVRFDWSVFVVAALGVIGLAIVGVLTPFPWSAGGNWDCRSCARLTLGVSLHL